MWTADHLEAHRAALTGHCYRMLGSSVDADDAVQETMVRAWRALERFDGRASLRTWLHRIATNVCLDALEDRGRRERPMAAPAGTVDDALEARPREHWLEPIADARAIPEGADPSERLALRESIRLAFVAALQELPPRQRAVLLLSDVLDWSAAEIAEGLDASVPSVNSALQRARAALAARGEGRPRGERTADEAVVARFVEAFERYDVDALVGLLREDVRMNMPPYALWLEGREAVRAWLLGRGAGCRGSRVVRTWANGCPAYAQYRPPAGPGGPYQPWALAVLELDGDRVATWTSFLETEAWFPRFGVPLELPSREVTEDR